MIIMKSFSLPPIGLRIVKSSLGVFICFMIYILRAQQGIPFYTMLAVLWCIRPDVGTSMQMGKQRTIGTMIGAFFGLIVILFNEEFLAAITIPNDFLRYIIISVMIIPVIYTTVLIDKKNASYFSCVVFLSIVVNHIGDASPVQFVANRVIDTMIGIIVGVFINYFHIPVRKQNDILFVSGLDETLLTLNESMTPYSKNTLNQLLNDGALFTVATLRTPASLIKPLQDIHLNLPVVAMDGAVLYDMREKKYIHAFVMSYNTVLKLYQFMAPYGFHCFTNVIVDDVLVIYYGDFQNEVEENLFHEMRRSPYRNYVKRQLPQDEAVVYLMLLAEKTALQCMYDDLLASDLSRNLKILFYDSHDYPGYSYVKIYNKNATKQHMMDYLKADLNVTKTITFGSIEGKYDVLIHEGDQNKVVKTLKKMYEVPVWKR